ncbi:lipoate--protein ligase family protein [Oerskovia turbata]|uniref:Lipoate--protein ligase family protein n=1 Tax=Oerskovia turbata TaxID=1713 RepID=A0A4Q1L1B4_9CELL|nr:lipoate--protein ligase family protein [Oerskovia turbata]RXR26375.1 lipoate--protein ligase family protein [Oerskovia turbata]RXR36550.1 lipoate--protein ligase family protein [Oerskovia turbata]TGJ97563.1 lipoate--protein ligase family protein [Actinotalea fermentans ATCC 43279 = JCM 9966 = DSM 3133]
MRGEYKVPGGKLVAVDVETDEGRLSRVALSGDFFLEPDDALDDINAALTGLPETSTVADLTRAIEAVLTDDITMVGFSPEAVAIAVRRALGHATGWDDHVFEIIHEGPEQPAMHLALDQVLTEELDAGRRGPTLRIWEWGAPAVIIGSFQSLKNEVDPEGAAKHGIAVVRRISGGGAMFVEPGNTITYSLTVPASLVEGLSFERSYAFLDDWVLGALADVGVNATYKPLNDIASPAGKIAGAAQKRLRGGAVLHHVTMAYDIDADKMLEVLRIGREKMSDKGTKSANKRVDPVRSQTGMAREEVIEAFKAHFRSRYRTVDGAVRAGERAQAEELVRTKFGTEGWTSRVP